MRYSTSKEYVDITLHRDDIEAVLKDLEKGLESNNTAAVAFKLYQRFIDYRSKLINRGLTGEDYLAQKPLRKKSRLESKEPKFTLGKD